MASTSSTVSTVAPQPAVADAVRQSMRIVQCRTNDGSLVKVREGLLYQCALFRQMYADLDMAAMELSTFELPLEMTAVVLAKIVTWCEYFTDKEDPVVTEKDLTRERNWFTLDEFTTTFFEKKSNQELMELLTAANFLDLKSLYLYGCQTMAARIQSAGTPDKIRELLGEPDDLTAEEVEEINRQNVWCNY